jgi:hypothetical protein
MVDAKTECEDLMNATRPFAEHIPGSWLRWRGL